MTTHAQGSLTVPASHLQAEYFSAATDGFSNDNLLVLLELAGDLDIPALRTAFDLLNRRHEILRTSFSERASGVVQWIETTNPPQLIHVDLVGISPVGPRLHHFVTDELNRPFSLSTPPLWRVTLFGIAVDRHVLAITLHHSICDGWSGEIIRRELSALYAAVRANRESGLPPLGVQFADYAASQHRAVEPTLIDKWHKLLRPLPPAPRLPDSGQWSPGKPFTVAVRPFPLVSAPDLAALRQIANASPTPKPASLADALHAAVAAVTSPFFDDRLILGVAFANRAHPDLYPLIGPVFDHVPVPVQISKRTTFSKLVVDFSLSRARAIRSYLALGCITREFAHELGPDRLIFDVEANYISRGGSNAPMVSEGSEVTFRYFRDLTPLDHDICLSREISANGRLGFQMFATESGTLDGFIFANADAIGWERADALAHNFSTTLSLLARYPNDPIRTVVINQH
jgi:hypothetical protein